ncbi:MAG TPA: creatininase family protein [Candidatus Obscuribacterales bacterium]
MVVEKETGRRGVLLQELTWLEAEQVLTADAVVVIPLGAAAKEHGPHLKLKNDLLIAEYLRDRVIDAAAVVVAPTVAYHYYPAFVEYPGSTTLSLETAKNLIVDICRSLARFGPRRFYVINTGISTLKALEPAAAQLAAEGLILRYTNLALSLSEVERQVLSQEGGSHADEGETSMMLYIAPESVDMNKAAKDYRPGSGPLTRSPDGSGVYSPTGVWGDATLATREKGEKLVETLVAAVLSEIEELRCANLESA